MKVRIYAWVYGVVMLGCGGAAVPQDALTAAQADVKGAEVGGAADNPKAMLHLKLARDQIGTAQKQIGAGDYEATGRTLARAQEDAELALALDKEAHAQGDASEANEQVGKLRKEIGKRSFEARDSCRWSHLKARARAAGYGQTSPRYGAA